MGGRETSRRASYLKGGFSRLLVWHVSHSPLVCLSLSGKVNLCLSLSLLIAAMHQLALMTNFSAPTRIHVTKSHLRTKPRFPTFRFLALIMSIFSMFPLFAAVLLLLVFCCMPGVAQNTKIGSFQQGGNLPARWQGVKCSCTILKLKEHKSFCALPSQKSMGHTKFHGRLRWWFVTP